MTNLLSYFRKTGGSVRQPRSGYRFASGPVAGLRIRLKMALSVALIAATAYSTTASAAAPQTRVKLQVLLEGAADGTAGLMRTNLWDRNLLDTVQLPQSSPQTPCRDGVSETINITNPNAGRTPVDWVCVELRSASDFSIVRARFIGFVQANGFIVRNNGTIPRVLIDQTADHYAVVYHKSHLPVASQPVAVINNLLKNDFRTQSSGPFFGAHQIPVGSRWAMIAGNTLQNTVNDVRQINGSDLNAWSTENGNFGQYLATDLNMDGDVSGADNILFTDKNGLFVNMPF